MERTLLVFGLHACAATLKRAAHEVLELWIRRDAGAELQAMADQASALGVVVRTGFYGAKGQLLRSILHPKEVSEAFVSDSLAFIALMAAVALSLYAWSATAMNSAGASPKSARPSA